MAWQGCPTTLFRGLKKTNGKVVVLDADYIGQTTMVARDSDTYYKMIGQGWCDEPQDALDQFEQAEQSVSNEATYRAAADRKLSEPAQREAEAYEASVPMAHVPVIPEQVKKPRGRPKKA